MFSGLKIAKKDGNLDGALKGKEMKITKKQLKNIIREELEIALESPMHDPRNPGLVGGPETQSSGGVLGKAFEVLKFLASLTAKMTPEEQAAFDKANTGLPPIDDISAEGPSNLWPEGKQRSNQKGKQ